MPKTEAQTDGKVKRSYQSSEFYSDCSKAGMLYASLVRSPAASGTITNIAVPDLPEGYFLFTAKDIPGKNAIRTLDCETPIFCSEKVMYPGEPLGIIVGPDEKKVYELTGDVEITFDMNTLESALESVAKDYVRPVIKLPGDQTKANESQIAEIVRAMNLTPASENISAPSSSFEEQRTGEPIIPVQIKNETTVAAQRTVKTGIFTADTKEAREEQEAFFTSADYDITGTWSQTIMQPDWNETNGAFCFVDDGILNVYTSTQWPSYLQSVLSATLDIDDDLISVKKTKSTGQSTNGIWRNATLAVQTAVASYLTGKPVKLMLSREEQHLFMAIGMPVMVKHRTAVTKDGHITAMQINIEADIGAWNPFAQEIADRLVIASCGVYTPENINVTARAVTSSKPPTSIYSQMIDSQSFFAVENQLSLIADKTNMLPGEIRDLNMNAHAKDMPFIFKLEKTSDVLNNVLSVSDFNRKYITFRMETKQILEGKNGVFFPVPLRGIGIACAFDGSGYFSTNIYNTSHKMELTLESDGTLTIHSLVPSSSICDIWKRTAADMLGIEPGAVRINPDFSDSSAGPLPEDIYSNFSIMIQLLKKSCADLKRKKTHAALPLTSRQSVSSLVKKQWDKTKFRGTPFHTTSFGSAVVELELDPYTFREKIKGIWITIDCGELLSIKSAERTIRLAIQQELGQLIEAETVPCSSIAVSFIQSDANPSQIGELIHDIIPAAFTAALSQALAVQIEKLPCTAELICTQSSTQKDSQNENTTNA